MEKYFRISNEVNDENVISLNRNVLFTDKINNMSHLKFNNPSEVKEVKIAPHPEYSKPLVLCMDLELSDIELIEYLEGDCFDVMMLRHIIKNLPYYSQNVKVIESTIRKNIDKYKPIVRETLERYGYEFGENKGE